jgi:YHS domain-containing protein
MQTINTNWKNIGLWWYDPVSYFEIMRKTPSLWKKEFSSVEENITYYFRNQKNKELFDKNPSQYLPQYGWYCATAISEWKTAPIDPFTFRIEDNKLYLFYRDRWWNNTTNDRDSNHENRKKSANILWENKDIKNNGSGIIYSSRWIWFKNLFSS